MVKILSEDERLKKYTPEYFTGRRCPEIRTWEAQRLRPDQLAAIGYALGYPDYESVRRVLSLDKDPRAIPDFLFSRYACMLDEHKTRTPGCILDIGCGRGELMLSFGIIGLRCVGIDPSPGAAELIPVTMDTWYRVQQEEYEFWPCNMQNGIGHVWDRGILLDTVIMCESMEHIPEDEFETAWPVVCELLTETGGMFIAVNHIDKWPIPVDHTGYDHIRRVDDDLYDRLIKSAREVIFRQGSHLVLGF